MPESLGIALHILLVVSGLIAAAAVGCAFVMAGYHWRARRFEAKQRQRGRWDADGPLYPTEGPPGWAGRDFAERREVIGEWVPRPIDRDPPLRRRKRRPKSG